MQNNISDNEEPSRAFMDSLTASDDIHKQAMRRATDMTDKNTQIEMERNLDSLVAMVSELYEKVHRVERVLIAEETLEVEPSEVDERGPVGLLKDAQDLVKETQLCSVSHLQKHFKISYKRAFGLLDALEEEGDIAPYRGQPERVVNQ